MSIDFDKSHGLGNDFVIIEQRNLPQALQRETISALADRHSGIGFDQLLVLSSFVQQTDGSTWRVQIYNADGSSAKQCINGMRAVALWLQRRQLLQQPTVLQLADGTVLVGAAEHGDYYVELALPSMHGLLNPCRHADQVFVKACAVSVGNPHLIVFSDQPQQHRQQLGQSMAAANAVWQRHVDLSEAFRELARDGCNIGFISCHSEQPLHVQLFVWERGSGPTHACGSAACAAAAVVLHEHGFSRVVVEQPGGKLILEQINNQSLRVTGAARHVFSGILDQQLLQAE